jgi:hypothetical protein
MSESSTKSPSKRRAVNFTIAAVAVGAVAASGAAFAGPAGASTPTKTVVSRNCANGATVSLQLRHADGRIEAGFEVDHAKVNSVWRVRLLHDGATYFLGKRSAAAPDGTLSVDRVLPNMAGVDTVSGSAYNLATGQVCRISGQI